MGSGIITNNGKNWLINRAYKEVSDYDEVYYMKLGVGSTTPSVTDTDLELPIPISNGTVNDSGENTLTGSSGGTNSTANTTTFKGGSGLIDDTAQNLIGNDTSVNKVWSIADLGVAGVNVIADQYVSAWLYIKDAITLAKIVSAEFKFGEDSSNYYSKTLLVADLIVGWNWIHSYPNKVNELSETGTVTGDLEYFEIKIVTNNATDEFVAGDVVYDLLRCYQDSDFLRTLESGYPTFNTTDKSVKTRIRVATPFANGFLISEVGVFTKDLIMITRDTFTGESKDRSDEFAFNITDKVV